MIDRLNKWLAIGLAVFALALWRIRGVGRRGKNYAPGPPTLPLVGNIHQIPSSKGHLQFEKWAREYGPIYSLVLGTKNVVVLSSDVVAKDLLDKRGNIYSSRPELYMGQEIASGGLRPLFMEYGTFWRMIRKVAHDVLNVKTARSFVPYQELENKVMLRDFLHKPKDFMDHIRRYTTSLTSQMAFGFRTPTSSDPELIEMFHNFDELSEMAGTQAAALLDLFPLLRRLPDSVLPIRRRGHELHKREKKLFMKYFLNARDQLSSNTSKPCCCIDVLKAQKKEGFSDDIACYMTGSLLQAGAETTAAILASFVLAMVLFPEVAKEAQAELDRVCGNRLPDLNDVPDLHYLRGCMKETLRWMPPTTLGVPHATSKEDTYMGYYIPKGTTVILNVWAIHNDPKRHPDPRRFNPSRWTGDLQNSAESALSADATKRDHFVFGAGRRMCQGMHIADRSLFLAMSRTLWAFDFARAKNKVTGEEIVPDPNKTSDGLFMCPLPFEASIRPRSEEKAAQIEQAADEAMEFLDDQLQWKTVPEGLKWNDYNDEDSIE